MSRPDLAVEAVTRLKDQGYEAGVNAPIEQDTHSFVSVWTTGEDEDTDSEGSQGEGNGEEGEEEGGGGHDGREKRRWGEVGDGEGRGW